MLRVKLNVDYSKLKAKEKSANTVAQEMLDQQILKDSNLYVPKDTGNLEGSSISSSLIGKGKIIWNTPYARRLYYNPQYNFSKDKNPQAQGLWFEAAKSVKMKEWEELVSKIYKNSFNGGK